MKIKPVKDRLNRYCGPAALSAISGCSTAVASALLRDYHGKTYIKGATNSEMFHALRHLGFSAARTHDGDGHTFAAWLRQTRKERGKRVFLVNIGWHYAVIQGRRYICAMRREGCSLGDAPMRRAVFKRAWEITELSGKSELAKRMRRKYDPIKREARPAKPAPTKDDLRTKKLGAVELRLKRWTTRLKRAQTAIRKLTRSRGALLRRAANETQHQLAA